MSRPDRVRAAYVRDVYRMCTRGVRAPAILREVRP